eukprot:8788481-Heterocapsa_arctica.AAC.1
MPTEVEDKTTKEDIFKMGDYKESTEHSQTNKRKGGVIYKEEKKREPASRVSTSLVHNWILSSC